METDKLNCLLKNRAKIQILLIVIFIASSCFFYSERDEKLPTVDNKDQYNSFVSGGLCSPPCWNGLRICQSHIDETTELLRSSNFLDIGSVELNDIVGNTSQCNEIIDDKENVALSIMCKYDDERICARLNFYDDILDSVSYYPNYKLSLEELIEVFGDPEYVSIQPWGAECMACDMDLFYPKINLVIGHSSNECSAWEKRCRYVIDGEPLDLSIQVTYIGILPDSFFEQRDMANYYSWPGFE